jgi:hypothetical protein
MYVCMYARMHVIMNVCMHVFLYFMTRGIQLIYTGRPLRVLKTEYNMDWELNRGPEMRDLLAKGVVPYKTDAEKMKYACQPVFRSVRFKSMW